MVVCHDYLEITVNLTLFNSTIAGGVSEKLENNDIKWITPAEISNYDFCQPDEKFLKIIDNDCWHNLM